MTDLKPTNLFLPDGDISRVKLLDFGVARRVVHSTAMTRSGMIVGTPEYMAPEQARGVRELTPAADLFALGCVLYECLAGESPFAGAHIAAVLVRILFEEPVPISQRRTGIPQDVQDLLEALLVKAPDERIANASELVARVAAIGDLSALPQTYSMAMAETAVPHRADSEQVLLSLVLALPPNPADTFAASNFVADATQGATRRSSLLAELRSFGAQADQLLGGALVATVPQMASAKDQATVGARCAAKIKEAWPEAQVVIVTGRGVRSGGSLAGEVLDRAWQMLSKSPAAAATSTSSPITLDQATAGLLRDRFELTPLSSLDGGFALGSERLDPDSGRLLLGKPTPCVGRERELAMLETLYNECKNEGMAQAVLVLAPPGFGKSRLRHEFVRRLESRGETPIVLLGRSDPLKTRSAYGPLGDALRQRMELHAGLLPAELQKRLSQRIAMVLPEADAQRVTVFIGELCGIPFSDDAHPQLRAARQDPRAMYDQVEQAWLDGLRLMRTEEPLLLILEDLHWSDALTVRLVDAMLRRSGDHPLMVLALARPEVHEQYPNLWVKSAVSVSLQPLSRKAGERLVRQILGGDVPADRVDRIIAQAAGNPLYLEELIRATAEGKTAELPETVAAMIQARLGRLPTATRRVLRAASVFGETFWQGGIQRLLRGQLGDDGVPELLSILMQEELIEQTPECRFANEKQYRFRHALVRDAAYALLSPLEIVAWHAAAGAFLETVGEPQAIVVAEHFDRGQQPAQAARFYSRATEQSYEAGSYEAACHAAQRGLACGAQGEDRARVFGILLITYFWDARFQEALALAPEALAVLTPGTKSWCRGFHGLFTAAMSMQHPLLAELVPPFLSAEPQPEARSTFVDTAAVLCCATAMAGQVATATAFRERMNQVVKTVPPDDPCRAWYHYAEAYYAFEVKGLLFSGLAHMEQSANVALSMGLRQVWFGFAPWVARYLGEVGKRAAGLRLLREIAAMPRQGLHDLGLHFVAVFLAQCLSFSTDPKDHREAETLLADCVEFVVPQVQGLSHGTLSRLAYLRGELERAQLEAEACGKGLQPFPSWRSSFVVVELRILRAQGKHAEVLQLCSQIDHEYSSLGIEPVGLVALLVEWAEVQLNADPCDTAQTTVERALRILRRRIADASNAEDIAIYLRELPEHTRLMELAEKLGLDTSDLRAQQAVQPGN